MTTATTTGQATATTYFTHFMPEEVKAFTEGDCWELARVLGNTYDLSVVILVFPFMGLIHAGVRLPDGRIIDIEGTWNDEQWTKRTQEECGFRDGDMKFIEFSSSEYQAALNGEVPTEEYYSLMDTTKYGFRHPEYTNRVHEYASVIMELVK